MPACRVGGTVSCVARARTDFFRGRRRLVCTPAHTHLLSGRERRGQQSQPQRLRGIRLEDELEIPRAVRRLQMTVSAQLLGPVRRYRGRSTEALVTHPA